MHRSRPGPIGIQGALQLPTKRLVVSADASSATRKRSTLVSWRLGLVLFGIAAEMGVIRSNPLTNGIRKSLLCASQPSLHSTRMNLKVGADSTETPLAFRTCLS